MRLEMATNPVTPLIVNLDVKDGDYDGVVVVTDSVDKLTGNLEVLQKPLKEYSEIDEAVTKDVVVVRTDAIPSKRLIFAPTGPLNRDVDDVRRYGEAAQKGTKRALDAGCKQPLLVCLKDKNFPHAQGVAALGALHALYVPLEIRDDVPDKAVKAKKLGVWDDDKNMVERGVFLVSACESGRITARDIGGSDPEKMAAPNVAAYVQNTFKDTCIKVEIISDLPTLEKEFPVLAAVNRAANVVDRHQARVIFLEYEGDGPIDRTVFLVGKGITYDTGGLDIKAGGIMAGMHRDKCGAAAVAGFFKTLSLTKPKGLKVVGGMAMVRNSVGPDGYVSDEIITSRAGARIRVGNTDAEGRMVMTDVLCRLKERALDAVNPHLFTIATLTGHAILSMGPAYSIIMDNGPACKVNMAQKIQASGEGMADPFEVSTIRREDYEFHKGKSEYEDLLSANNSASSRTSRGHQSPSAFMIMASGLDKHGIDSDKPLPYSHIDIAGSSGPFPGIPTGAPILALAAQFVLSRLK